MSESKTTAILLLSCPDRIGLVSRLSHFVFERGGNILDLDEHVDIDEKIFFVRMAWDMSNFSIKQEGITIQSLSSRILDSSISNSFLSMHLLLYFSNYLAILTVFARICFFTMIYLFKYLIYS